MSHKRFVVLGAKRSGLAAAKLLKQKGLSVFVSDKSEKIEPGVIEALEKLGIEYEFGKHSERVYESDIAVISPGIPTNAPVVQTLLSSNKAVVSEIEMAVWFCKSKVVAITGTDGKTTVTSLLKHILELDAKEKGYRVAALGNIGEAFSSKVSELGENDIVVLEVSSFQLDFCKTFKPNVAIITNISPDHMDRYDQDITKYEASKYKITENQVASDWMIFNNDDRRLHEHFYNKPGSTKAKTLAFGLDVKSMKEIQHWCSVENEIVVLKFNQEKETLMNVQEISSPNFRGTHNIYNALAAAAAARILQVKQELILDGIKTFKGVEHRLEFVREVGGVQYINDSKATTINALNCALDAMSGKVVLIMGGRDKGNDYNTIRELVKEKVRAIVAIGEAKEKIQSELGKDANIMISDTLDGAVKLAHELSKPGDSVLLSPSCASFDMFQSYEARGKAFKSLVAAL